MPSLEVHVIGGGTGESIVLGIPEAGWWAVVDAYSPKPTNVDGNATLKFLRTRNVQRLAFVALTHPHHDHYSGLAILFDHLEVVAFWQYDGLDRKQLAMVLEGAADPVDKPDSLFELFKKVRALEKCHAITRRTMAPHAQLPTGVPDNIPLAITALSPSGRDRQRYLETVARCFHAEGKLIASHARQINHNQIAAALLIEFGEATVLLGSDVESGGWQQILTDFSHKRLNSQVVKVSHHGSINGYCAGLWPILCPTPGLAIITPFASHDLPQLEALTHIRPHTGDIFVTADPSHLREVSENLTIEEKLAFSVFSNLHYETAEASEQDAHTCSLFIETSGHVRVQAGSGVVRRIAA